VTAFFNEMSRIGKSIETESALAVALAEGWLHFEMIKML
jgi:hypothetical protein